MSNQHLKLHPLTGNTDHDLTGLIPGQILNINEPGTTISSSGVYALSGSISANTYYSGNTNLYDIFSGSNLWASSTGLNSIVANNGTNSA